MSAQKLHQSTLETTLDKFQTHFTTSYATTQNQEKNNNQAWEMWRIRSSVESNPSLE